MRELHPAYVAGIVDGEGCIRIYRNKPKHQGMSPIHALQVNVVNTNLELVAKLQEQYGGGVYSKRTIPWKECYFWVLPARQLKSFLESILPYLIVKKRQAKVGLEFLSKKMTVRGKRVGMLPKEEISLREAYYLQMKGLNRRGEI